MPPSAPLSMPPPIPVPAFLSDEPVHPANGDRTVSAGLAPETEKTDGTAADEGRKEDGMAVVKPPEPKPGPGGIRKKEKGAGAGVKRRITWVDDHGVDIAQIREFEPSDSDESDDEDGDEDSSQACSCVIQ